MFQKGKSVLIIDDNRDLVIVFKELLTDEGYTVFTAETGDEAVAIMELNKIDLAFLDLKLPDIQGEVLLGKMLRIQPITKVIIITGSEDIDSYIDTLQKGAIDYLVKPFTPHKIINIVKKVLPAVA